MTAATVPYHPEPPYADLPDLLESAHGIIASAASAGIAFADEWNTAQEAWLAQYAAALPALQRPHGAVIDVIEEIAPPRDPALEPLDPNAAPAVTVPNRIYINGIPLLISDHGPVIERIDTSPDNHGAVLVTMHVMARRVRIDAAHIVPAVSARTHAYTPGEAGIMEELGPDMSAVSTPDPTSQPQDTTTEHEEPDTDQPNPEPLAD